MTDETKVAAVSAGQHPEPIRIDSACENCSFAKLRWRKGEDYTSSYNSFDGEAQTSKRPETNYECRRYAPRGMVAIPSDCYGVDNFATMRSDDWCGEFQPNERIAAPYIAASAEQVSS